MLQHCASAVQILGLLERPVFKVSSLSNANRHVCVLNKAADGSDNNVLWSQLYDIVAIV